MKKEKSNPSKMRVVYVAPDTLQANAWNPNKQSEKDFALLLQSIKDDGFTQPILVSLEGTIIDGEHRWRAAKALNIEKIPVVQVSMTDAQMRVATIRHNKARGQHDRDLERSLFQELEEMGALSFAQEALLLEDFELESLLAGNEEAIAEMESAFVQTFERDKVSPPPKGQQDSKEQRAEAEQPHVSKALTEEPQPLSQGSQDASQAQQAQETEQGKGKATQETTTQETAVSVVSLPVDSLPVNGLPSLKGEPTIQETESVDVVPYIAGETKTRETDTNEALQEVAEQRRREQLIAQALAEREKGLEVGERKLFRLALVYEGKDAETVQAVLGEDPHAKLLALCQQRLFKTAIASVM